MDIVQARKKAREKAAQEARARGPEAPAKASPETLADADAKPKARPARAAAKPDPAKSKAKGSAPARPRSLKSSAPRAPAPEPSADVFLDMSFGENLPVDVMDAADLEPGKPPGAAPAPGAPAPARAEDDDFDLGPAATKPAAKPAAPTAAPAAGTFAAEAPARDLAVERLSSEKADFLELVSDDLYRREFGEEARVEAGEQMELISFRLAQETYAIRLTHVQQIIKLREITLVPRAPEYILGLVSLRGLIIPIFDLRRRLGLATREPTRETRIVVVMQGTKVIGLIVDRIEQVVRLPAGTIEPPPPILGDLEAEYIEGIGRFEGRMLILLNLSKVLAPPAPRETGH
jgi:purine-binding chemotaxis protein CheW